MRSIFKNSLHSFHLLNEKHYVLYFDSTDKTNEMNYEDFQAACNNFAGFAWQYNSKHLLVDTSNFQSQSQPDFTVWREQQLNQRYHSLGVQNFAHGTTQEFIEFIKDVPAENGKLQPRNFVSKQEALN